MGSTLKEIEQELLEKPYLLLFFTSARNWGKAEIERCIQLLAKMQK